MPPAIHRTQHYSVTVPLVAVAVVAISLIVIVSSRVQGQATCIQPHCVYLPALAAQSTPTAMPIPLPTPTLIPTQNDVYVHSARTFRYQDELYAWGEIVNGSAEPIWGPNATIVFVDDNDTPIVTTVARGTIGYLKTGERSPFGGYIHPAPYTLQDDKPQYHLSWQTDDYRYGDTLPLSVLTWHIEFEGEGGWARPGVYTTLLNETNQTLYPYIESLVYYSTNGHVEFVATPFQYCSSCIGIPPGEFREVFRELDPTRRIWQLLNLDASRAVLHVTGVVQ